MSSSTPCHPQHRLGDLLDRYLMIWISYSKLKGRIGSSSRVTQRRRWWALFVRSTDGLELDTSRQVFELMTAGRPFPRKLIGPLSATWPTFTLPQLRDRLTIFGARAYARMRSASREIPLSMPCFG